MGFLKKLTKSLDPSSLTKDLVGGLFGGGNDPGKAQLAEVLRLQREAALQANLGYAGAESQARRAIPLIQKSYGGAMEATSRAFDQGRRNVLEMGEKSLARDRQRMANYGLQGTTFSGSRGIIGDTSRRIAELDSALGQSLAGLNIGRGQAVAAGMTNLGNVMERRAQTQAQLTGNIAQSISSVQYQRKRDLFDLIGAVAPFAFMGMMGGGGGAAAAGGGGAALNSFQYPGGGF